VTDGYEMSWPLSKTQASFCGGARVSKSASDKVSIRDWHKKSCLILKILLNTQFICMAPFRQRRFEFSISVKDSTCSGTQGFYPISYP